MRELILYATPTGQLANACAAYFEAVEPTTAQTYPPHITLTGFFHRGPTGAGVAIDAASRLASSPPPDAIEVVALRATDDWVGLEISSPWLEDLAARFATAVQPDAGEDDIRLKDWLHLSLAYGIEDLETHRNMASQMIDPGADVTWEIALWERLADGSWHRLTAAVPPVSEQTGRTGPVG